MLPKTSEQGGVAERVRQMEAGLLLQKTGPKDIREAIDTVLSDPKYRQNAAGIAQGFRSCTGAKGAADKIEQCCQNKKKVQGTPLEPYVM